MFPISTTALIKYIWHSNKAIFLYKASNYSKNETIPNRVWIHPWSLVSFLSEWKCRAIAAIIPGTPATVSNMMMRLNWEMANSQPYSTGQKVWEVSIKPKTLKGSFKQNEFWDGQVSSNQKTFCMEDIWILFIQTQCVL